MQDPVFAACFGQAGKAWDVALQLAALRQQVGLSQKELARRLKTSQQTSAGSSRLATKANRWQTCGVLRASFTREFV